MKIVGKGDPAIEARIRVLWILHFAFLSSIAIYAVIYYFVFREEPPIDAPGISRDALLGGLVLASIALLIGGVVWPTLGKNLRPETAPDAASYLARAQVLMIISDAFFESIAICALMAGVLGLGPAPVLVAMGVAAALLAATSGRIAGWADEARRRARG